MGCFASKPSGFISYTGFNPKAETDMQLGGGGVAPFSKDYNINQPILYVLSIGETAETVIVM